MSEFVPIKQSQTDPYLPEKSDTEPVRLRLTRIDGTVRSCAADERVLAKDKPLLHLDHVLYGARGSEGAVRLYRELAVLDLATGAPWAPPPDPPKPFLTPLQAEFVALSHRIDAANAEKLDIALGGTSYPPGSTQHTDITRRLAIAFVLAREAIEAIIGTRIEDVQP